MEKRTNLFGMKKEKSLQEIQIDGNAFISKQVDIEHEQRLDENIEYANEQERKSTLPLSLSIIKHIAFFFVLIIGINLIGPKTKIKTAYANAPYLFYIGAVAIVLFLYLLILEKVRAKKVVQSEEFKDFVSHVDETIERSMVELEIPMDAQVIDVFSFTYRINKKGEKKINTNPFFHYMNTQLHVYVKDDCLCLADIYQEVAIPLSSLVEIRKINKRAITGGWNKEENVNQGRFKKYKMTVNNFGSIFIKPYYAVIINDPIGEFEFYVPCYDIDTIVDLTHLQIIESEK